MVGALDLDFVFSRVLLSVALILALARVAGILCRRLGLPVVIGELVVGVCLGPSVLGKLAPDLHREIFPPEVLPFLNIISKLGIVLFMFLVGLELDLDVVRRSGKRAVTISLTSIALPFLLGSAVGYLWLHDEHSCVAVRDATQIDEDIACTPDPGIPVSNPESVVGYQEVPRGGFSMFLGVSICGTAFAILARILADRNMFRIPLGLTLVACAAVDDIAAFALLAIVMSVITGASLAGVALTMALLVGYVVLLALVIRPVLQRLVVAPYQRAGRLLPEHFAIVLAGLFLSCLATYALDLNFILGAFLFGAAIPRPSEASILDKIAERLDGVAVTLLLPIFFLVTGQSVRITDLRRQDILPALVIVLVASLGKFVGGSISARLTGVPRRQAMAVGTLMNTRGLAELVILKIGYDSGVLDDAMFTMLVSATILTTLVSVPLLKFVYPDTWLQRDIAEADRRRNSNTTDRVVVVLGSGWSADSASVQAQVDLAVAYGAARASSQITLVHFVPGESGAGIGSFAGVGAVAEAMESLQTLRRHIIELGPACQVISRPAADVDAATIAEVARLAPDAVVLGSDLSVPASVASLAATGSDVLVIAGETPLRHIDGVRVAGIGGLADTAAVEIAARLGMHLGIPVDLRGHGPVRGARDLGRLGVRLDALDDDAALVTSNPDEPSLVTVVAGSRDRVPLSERLGSWSESAAVTPLTSI